MVALILGVAVVMAEKVQMVLNLMLVEVEEAALEVIQVLVALEDKVLVPLQAQLAGLVLVVKEILTIPQEAVEAVVV